MFGQELKKMGIATAYRYIEKNQKDNLRKLMTWVDRIAGEGPDSFEEQRKVIWDVLDHPESNMYQLIMRVIEEVDPDVGSRRIAHGILQLYSALNFSCFGHPRIAAFKKKFENTVFTTSGSTSSMTRMIS